MWFQELNLGLSQARHALSPLSHHIGPHLVSESSTVCGTFVGGARKHSNGRLIKVGPLRSHGSLVWAAESASGSETEPRVGQQQRGAGSVEGLGLRDGLARLLLTSHASRGLERNAASPSTAQETQEPGSPAPCLQQRERAGGEAAEPEVQQPLAPGSD